MSEEEQLQALELIAHCKKFIDEQGIHCAETIYQTDWVIENAYEFIQGVCEILGYQEEEQ